MYDPEVEKNRLNCSSITDFLSGVISLNCDSLRKEVKDLTSSFAFTVPSHFNIFFWISHKYTMCLGTVHPTTVWHKIKLVKNPMEVKVSWYPTRHRQTNASWLAAESQRRLFFAGGVVGCLCTSGRCYTHTCICAILLGLSGGKIKRTWSGELEGHGRGQRGWETWGMWCGIDATFSMFGVSLQHCNSSHGI